MIIEFALELIPSLTRDKQRDCYLIQNYEVLIHEEYFQQGKSFGAFVVFDHNFFMDHNRN